MKKPIRIELPTIFGMKTVNAYLFLEPEIVLVDCGEQTKQNWIALEKGLAQNGCSIKDIQKVIITHAHVDHMGMATQIADESGAEIWVSDVVYDWAWNLPYKWDERKTIFEEIVKAMKDPNSDANPLLAMIGMFQTVTKYWGIIPKERLKVFSKEGTIEMGGATWQVLYTPGHSITQTCFYQPESRQLISSDMLLKITPTPVFDVSPEDSSQRCLSLPMMLDSYEVIKSLDVDWVYPGHYEPFQNHKAMIDGQLSRIQIRKEQCFDLIEAGTNYLFDLFNILYTGRLGIVAIPMLVGYIDLLVLEGRIEQRETNLGVGYFVKN